jgi:hypothetical protein
MIITDTRFHLPIFNSAKACPIQDYDLKEIARLLSDSCHLLSAGA